MTTAILAMMISFLPAPGPQAAAEKPRLIRSVQFRGFSPVKPAEILSVLKREGLAPLLERPVDRDKLDRAQDVMSELIAARGKRGYRVMVRLRDMTPNSVELTFIATKN